MPELLASFSLKRRFSSYENFGIVLVKAMACRIPVVTSNIPELDEIVGDAGVRVDPQNAEAMGEAVCAILDSGDLRASLVEKGLERSKQFSWEWCAREALAIYEELARG